MSAVAKPSVRLSPDFQRVSAAEIKPAANKRPAPFSIRLTPDERAYLEAKAGNRSLGAYIRAQLLGDRVEKRQHDLRRPQIDQEQYAALLAALGQSRLSSNLNQLAQIPPRDGHPCRSASCSPYRVNRGLSPPSHPTTTTCVGTASITALRAMLGAHTKRPPKVGACKGIIQKQSRSE